MHSDDQKIIDLITRCRMRTEDAAKDKQDARTLVAWLVHEGVDKGHFSGECVLAFVDHERGFLTANETDQLLLVKLLEQLQGTYVRRADLSG